MTLGSDTTLSGVAITLGDTVKSDSTNRSLTINDSGTTTLAGAIGGSTDGERLSSLTTDAGGNTLLNAGAVRTSGAQTFGDAVTLGANTTLSGVAITLGSTVQSDGTNRSLAINDSGTTTLAGAIGGSTDTDKLSSLTTDAGGNTLLNAGAVRTTGTQTFGDAVTLGVNTALTASTVTTQEVLVGNAKTLTITGNAVLGDGVADTVTGLTTLSVSGTTAINTNTITSTGAQTYTGAVTLGTDTTLTATDASAVITLASTVDSAPSTASALAINASGMTSNVVLGGAVGGTDRLSSLAVTASDIDLNGGAVTTTGGQAYTGPVTLGADTTLVASGASAVIAMASSVNSASQVTPSALTLTAGGTGGNVVLSSTVGANKALSTLAVTASDIDLNGSAVTTTASQTYTGPVTLGANTTLTGVAITLGGTVMSDDRGRGGRIGLGGRAQQLEHQRRRQHHDQWR